MLDILAKLFLSSQDTDILPFQRVCGGIQHDDMQEVLRELDAQDSL